MQPISDKQVLNMAEKVGSFMEYWGFKQVHGKIWTLVFLAPEPVDANYIKASLKISKALTSMTIKDLLHYNVIFEVEKSRPGTQKYQINTEIANVILDVLRMRELSMLGELQECFSSLKASQKKSASDQVASVRLQELGTMIDSAQLLLMGMTAGDSVDFKLFDQSMNVSK